MLEKITALSSVFFTLMAGAQSDSGAVYQSAVNNALAVYHQFRGDESNLYQGVVQEPYRVSGSSTPYFNSDWQTGTVFYDGVQYNDALLKYDLLRDELVVQNSRTGNAFYLFKPRVDSFTLGERKFIHLKKESSKTAPPEGYYEKLTNGALTLLERHAKFYQEQFRTNNVEQHFEEKTTFYVLKDGVYQKLSGAKSLYAMTGNWKNKIREQLKQQGVEKQNDLQKTLTAIAETYNQLSH
jgi:hypothetical protein